RSPGRSEGPMESAACDDEVIRREHERWYAEQGHWLKDLRVWRAKSERMRSNLRLVEYLLAELDRHVLDHERRPVAHAARLRPPRGADELGAAGARCVFGERDA